MVRSSHYLFFMLIGEAICLGIKPYVLKIESFSVWPENGIFDNSKLRLVGRQRLVNGTVTLTNDLDDEHYSFSYESFSDPVGDGNFKLLPFYIPRTPICKAYEKYHSYISEHAEYGRQTDFPINRNVCPIPKGTYYLKNVGLTSKNWPAIMPRGFLRCNGSFFRNDELVSTVSITVLVEDE